MRALLTVFVTLMLAAPSGASQQNQTASVIQGIIAKQGTGEALSKVTVELRGGAQPISTTTERDGQFYFPNLMPGEYRVIAKRDGYVTAEYGQQWLNGPGQPITIAAGRGVSLRIWMFPTASMSGRITSADGQPVANAQVSALRSSYVGLERVLNTVQEARTNELGEYRLYWLTPGRYYLSVVIPPSSTNGMLQVNRGEQSATPGVYTSSNQSRTVLGLNAGGPVVGNTIVDFATSQGGVVFVNGGAVSPSGGAAQPPLFFPSTPEGDLATPIEVGPGVDSRGVDIRMTPVATYHVCGVAILEGPPPQPGARAQTPPNANVPPRVPPSVRTDDVCPNLSGGSALPVQSIAPIRLNAVGTRAEISNATGIQYTTPVDPGTGRFAFRNVTPGMYELSGTIAGMNARIPVLVRGDVENTVLTLSAGVDLRVHTVIEGKAGNPPELAGMRPYLGDDPPSPREAYVGAFTPEGDTPISNVTAGAYRVYVEPILNSVVAPSRTPSALLQNTFVKSITFGGVDALNRPLQFPGRANGVLEIVIGTKPGVFEGRVLNDKQQAIPGALVTMLPNSPQLRVFRSDMYKTTSTDAAGRFQIKGLPPGDYKAFAWAGVERDAWMDPFFLRANEERGAAIHVDEGQTRNTDLILIPPKF
jgi:hypothetical protein